MVGSVRLVVWCKIEVVGSTAAVSGELSGVVVVWAYGLWSVVQWRPRPVCVRGVWCFIDVLLAIRPHWMSCNVNGGRTIGHRAVEGRGFHELVHGSKLKS